MATEFATEPPTEEALSSYGSPGQHSGMHADVLSLPRSEDQYRHALLCCGTIQRILHGTFYVMKHDTIRSSHNRTAGASGCDRQQTVRPCRAAHDSTNYISTSKLTAGKPNIFPSADPAAGAQQQQLRLQLASIKRCSLQVSTSPVGNVSAVNTPCQSYIVQYDVHNTACRRNKHGT